MNENNGLSEMELRRGCVNVCVDDNTGEEVLLVLHKKAYLQAGKRNNPDACKECFNILMGKHWMTQNEEKAKMPPAALANGLFLGRQSSLLRKASEDFCRFIALATPYQKLVRLKLTGYTGPRGVAGNVAILPNKTVPITDTLPPPLEQTRKSFVIAFASGAAEGQGDEMLRKAKRWCEVDTEKYRAAYQFLKRTSPMYRQVKLDEERFKTGEDLANIVDLTVGCEGDEDVNRLFTEAFDKFEHTVYNALRDGEKARDSFHCLHDESSAAMMETVNLVPSIKHMYEALVNLAPENVSSEDLQREFVSRFSKASERVVAETEAFSDAASTAVLPTRQEILVARQSATCRAVAPKKNFFFRHHKNFHQKKKKKFFFGCGRFWKKKSKKKNPEKTIADGTVAT